MEGLTEGRMVHYILNQWDADSINVRRSDATDVPDRVRAGQWPMGAQAHVGNTVEAGEHVPAVIVRVWGQNGMVNLKCLLDGNDDYWASSIPFDDGLEGNRAGPDQRTWHWIEKA